MQSFLSEYTFIESAKALDNIRLNKQLLESRQILEILLEPNPDSIAWKHHPAVLMWKDYEKYYYLYILEIAKECNNRNIKITKNWSVITILYQNYLKSRKTNTPFWILDKYYLDKIVNTNRLNLYLKDPQYYKRYEKYTNGYIDVCCKKCKYFWVSHLPNYDQLKYRSLNFRD